MLLNITQQHCPPAGEVVDLLVPVHEVHSTIVVVVVCCTARCVGRELQIVGPQTIALCVGIAEHTSLQELVVAVRDTCTYAYMRGVFVLMLVRQQTSVVLALVA